MLRTYLYKLTKKDFFSLEYIFFGQSKKIAFYTGQSNLRLGLIRYSPDNVAVFSISQHAWFLYLAAELLYHFGSEV